MKIFKNIIGAFTNYDKVITAIKGGSTGVKSKAITKLATGTPPLMGTGIFFLYEAQELKDPYSLAIGIILILVSVWMVERMGDKISKIDSDGSND